jgi:hypothetical protein
MSIDKHVVSLELAKQLVAAGIVVESEFWWVNISGEWSVFPNYRLEVTGTNEKYPAPLSSELGELLPVQITIADETFYFLQNKEFVTYHNPNDDDADIWSEIDDTEANARAKMLLYLKEKGLL